MFRNRHFDAMQKAGVTAVLLVVAVTHSPRPSAGGETAPAVLLRDIRGLFKFKCGFCHWDEDAEAHLRLVSVDDIMIGGQSGPAVRAGKPGESLLWRKIANGRMPPKDEPALTASEKTKIRHWIERGRFPSRAAVRRAETKRLRSQARKHWAFRPIVDPEVPRVKDSRWPRGDIDHFILARLESRGLHPVGEADLFTLVRRLHYDLTGLPPSPEEISRLTKRNSQLWRLEPNGPASQRREVHPALLVELVDRLLASPEFGECWGRHWLDVARYSDTLGGGANYTLNDAWRYRDYVIDSFNKDKPYDRFVMEQTAGDLLPSATPSQRQEQLIATGFLAIGPKDFTDQDKVKLLADAIDEQLDTLGKAFTGLTLGCARCHGHKFDPIPLEDDYSLAGIFRSTQTLQKMDDTRKFSNTPSWNRILLPTLGPKTIEDFTERFRAEQAALDRRAANLQSQIVELRQQKRRLENGSDGMTAIASAARAIQKIDKQVVAAERRKEKLIFRKKGRATLKNYFGIPYPSILGVLEGRSPADARIDLHGNPHQQGPAVPRGVLRAFGSVCPPIPGSQSGRLQLARWLTNSQHPLTARVMVNRVWSHLFGRGIVASTDNFGTRGSRPTHPELLDYLAVRFRRPVGADGYGGSRIHSSAFLPAMHQGTAIGTATLPVAQVKLRNLSNTRLPRRLQSGQMRLLRKMSRDHRRRVDADYEIDGLIQSLEVAFHMQTEATEILDVTKETRATQNLYGLNDPTTDDFGRQCLMARRMSEAGVRFVLVTHSIRKQYASIREWDQHKNLESNHRKNARQVDRPIAALLSDLKSRGLLDETLVIWGGEFGRTPMIEIPEGKPNKITPASGRNHDPLGFTIWLAGGGVKRGFSHGGTDDIGYRAVDGRVHMHDLHATILHLLGLDDRRLSFPYAGLDVRLTGVEDRTVVREIIA